MPTIPVNDLHMHYTERGEGPTALLLHAATAEGAMMGWLAQIAIKAGFNAVQPDQRGHGQTENPAPDVHMPRLVDDVLELIYALGRAPVHGIGYSMGGAVLLYAALKRPDFFKSLVLLGSNYKPTTQHRLEQLLGPFEGRPADQQMVFHPQTGFTVEWGEVSLDPFRSLNHPTLLMIGDRDEFNDVEDNVELYRAMPNANLLVVPHADHLAIVRHPNVMQAMVDFYANISR